MNATSEKETRTPVNGFVFLRSYYEAIQGLPDEYRLELLDALLHYAFQGTAPEQLSPLIRCSFTLLVPNIDSSIRRYAANVENGRKGGRPQKQPVSPAENPTETQPKPSENQDKDKDMDMDTDRETETEMEMEAERETEKATEHLKEKRTKESAAAQMPCVSENAVDTPADSVERSAPVPTELLTTPVDAPKFHADGFAASAFPPPAEKLMDIPEPDFSLSLRDADDAQNAAFRQRRTQLLQALRRLPA